LCSFVKKKFRSKIRSIIEAVMYSFQA